jgi:transcriptional regulator with XRE-family HTH domain
MLNEVIRMSFGEQLKIVRVSHGMRQRELAEKIKATNTSISNWEKGVSHPSAAYVEAIAKVLSVSVFDLLGELSMNEIQDLKDNRTVTDDEGETVWIYGFEENMAILFYDALIDKLEMADRESPYDYVPWQLHDKPMREAERHILAKIDVDMINWEKLAVDGGKEVIQSYSRLTAEGKAVMLDIILGVLRVPAFIKQAAHDADTTTQAVANANDTTVNTLQRIRNQLRGEL